MRITSPLLALLAAALVACGTVSEPQPAAPAAAEPPTPAPVAVAEPAPAAAPTPVAEPAPAPVKARRVARKAPAPVAPPPAAPAAPTEQEIAAALAEVDEALGRFVLEQMRFAAPANMKQNTPGTATLDFNAADAFERARAAIAASDKVRRAGIEVTGRVQSRLAGERIGVKPGSPETQELNGSRPGQWRWELLPTTEGKAQVHLVISVETQVAGSAAPRAVHTLDREITVEGAPAPAQPGFFAANWWWLLIVALVASAGAWVMQRRRAG